MNLCAVYTCPNGGFKGCWISMPIWHNQSRWPTFFWDQLLGKPAACFFFVLFPSAGIHHPHTQFTYPPLFCVKRHIVWNLRGPCMNANSLSVHERGATPADAEKVMKQIHLESAAVCWPTNDGSFFILIVRPGNQTWLVGATLVSGRSKEI